MAEGTPAPEMPKNMTLRDVAYQGAKKASNADQFIENYAKTFRAILEIEKNAIEEVLEADYRARDMTTLGR